MDKLKSSAVDLVGNYWINIWITCVDKSERT